MDTIWVLCFVDMNFQRYDVALFLASLKKVYNGARGEGGEKKNKKRKDFIIVVAKS